jgi:nuclear pore complex protein Nup54
MGTGTGMGTPRKGQGRMLGQVNELWGAVEEIRRRRRGGRTEGREAWLADEKVLAEVAEVSEDPRADLIGQSINRSIDQQ